MEREDEKSHYDDDDDASNRRRIADSNETIIKESQEEEEDDEEDEEYASLFDCCCPQNQRSSTQSHGYRKRMCRGLGHEWSSNTASHAYHSQLSIYSKDDCGPSIRVAFRNETPEPLYLCWVGGVKETNSIPPKLYHYYTLHPNNNNINNNSDRRRCIIVSEKEYHIEHTFLGHAFVILRKQHQQQQKEEEEEEEEETGISEEFKHEKDHDPPEQNNKNNNNNDDNNLILSSSSSSFHKDQNTQTNHDNNNVKNIIAAYQPMEFFLPQTEKKRYQTKNEDDDLWNEDYCVHVVTISRRNNNNKQHSWFNPWSFLRRQQQQQLHHHNNNNNTTQVPYEYSLTVQEGTIDKTPLNTSNKVYESMTLGGWPIHYEAGLWNHTTNNNNSEDDNDNNNELRSILERHIYKASHFLPPYARNKLIQSTPIWINKSQLYGPKSSPIHGKGMCYHNSDPKWLQDNGMNPKKAGGIELYDALEYYNTSSDCHLLWGEGGVFLHEFSHAYHDKCCYNGFENEDIIQCYEQSVHKKGLYDMVPVHELSQNDGQQQQRQQQRSVARAYAAENPMEYFAELSTAFLGGIPPSSPPETTTTTMTTDEEKENENKKEDEIKNEKKKKDDDDEFNKWFPFNRKQVCDHDPEAYEMLKKLWKVNDDDDNDDDKK